MVTTFCFLGFFTPILHCLFFFNNSFCFSCALSDLILRFRNPLKSSLELVYSLKFTSLVGPKYLKYSLFFSNFWYNLFNMSFIFLRSLNIYAALDWLFLSSGLSSIGSVGSFSFDYFKASTCFFLDLQLFLFVFQTLFLKEDK